MQKIQDIPRSVPDIKDEIARFRTQIRIDTGLGVVPSRNNR